MKILHRTLVTVFVITALLILRPLSAQAQQTFYSVTSLGDQLRIIDAATGVTVSRVTITLPGLPGSTILGANGLAKHPQTGQLFVLLSLLPRCSVRPCLRELVTIDPVSGIATSVGNTGDAFAGLAFSSTGTLYGVTGDGGIVPETLYTLNTANAAKTFVRTLGNGDSGEAIAFNPDNGLIYHASGAQSRIFETINPSTLSITNIPLSGVVYLEGAALSYWQSQGIFLMVDTPPGFPPNLLRITPGGIVSCTGGVDHVDPMTGTVVCVGSVDHYGKGLAATGPGSTTFHVDCPAISLQNAINVAQSGDTILVTGTCTENLLVRNDKVRVFLNGGGTATINGSDPTRPVFDVRGKAVSIQGLTVTGGSSGIEVQRGASAVVDSNVIQNTGGSGVVVNQLAFAVLTNNMIQGNVEDGVVIRNGGAAHVGFNNTTETTASSNTIRTNSGHGLRVSGSSSARAVGNQILNNGGGGVRITGGSQADIANNTIESNGGDGVFVGQNAVVNLGEDSGSSIFELPNTTNGNNAGFGVACDDGGVANGRVGTLNGINGTTSFDSSCINDLQ